MSVIFHALFATMGEASIRQYMLVHEFIGVRKRVFVVVFFFFGQYGVAPGSKRLDEKSYYSKPGKRW